MTVNSKIEQIIAEIEEYIEGCKIQPLSNGTRIIVNKETIDELITELRLKSPEEIKKYQKIISNKEAIIAAANAQAEEIIAAAQIQNDEMVSKQEVLQVAYKQAQEVVSIAEKQADEIVGNANREAEELIRNALVYTDDLLKSAEEVLVNSLEAARTRSEELVTSLQEHLNIVQSNRAELFPQQPAYEEEAMVMETAEGGTAGDSGNGEGM